MNTLAGLLEELYPALSELPPAQRAALTAPATVLAVPPGTMLFAEKQACQGFPLLLTGRIKVVKTTPGGREMVLYRVEPGGSCVISSSCLLGRAPYNARGIAETALTLAILPAPVFDSLLIASPRFRDYVFQLFGERLAELMELIEAVAFQRLDQRLARLLLARSEKGQVLHVTHQALAEELGSVREIVSRLLKSFADQGLVALSREQIKLLNNEGLAALAAAS